MNQHWKNWLNTWELKKKIWLFRVLTSALKEFRASKVKLAQYGVDGVEEVIFDTVETANAPVEFYTLQGVRLNGAPTKGFYIVKQGAKALKFYKR